LQNLIFFVKQISSLIASIALAPLVLLHGAVMAEKIPSEPNPTQATQDNIQTYAGMGAINSCILMTKLNQSALRSIEVSTAMMTNVLLVKHGGQIPGNSTPLNSEQLMTGSAVNIMFTIKSTCFNQLNKADQDFITSTLSKAEDSMKKAQQKP
jgi:hypothetical protein